jgi:hypothetical protein
MMWLNVALCLSLNVASAETFLDPPKQNIQQQYDDIDKFFESMSRQPTRVNRRDLGASLRASKPRLSGNMWQDGLQNPYKRAQALKAAGALSNIGQAAIGSSMGPELALQLLEAGKQLIATSDPQFMTVGSNLEQESAAITANNQDLAQSIAANVNATPMPDLSSYNPTSSDVQYGTMAQAATAQIAGAVLTTVGTVAGAVIAAYCSEGTGTVQGAMYGAALGGMLGNAVGNAIDGQQGNANAGLTQMGVQAAQMAVQTSATKKTDAMQAGQQTNQGATGQTAPIGSAVGGAMVPNGPIAPPASQPVNTGAAAGATGI